MWGYCWVALTDGRIARSTARSTGQEKLLLSFSATIETQHAIKPLPRPGGYRNEALTPYSKTTPTCTEEKLDHLQVTFVAGKSEGTLLELIGVGVDVSTIVQQQLGHTYKGNPLITTSPINCTLTLCRTSSTLTSSLI